MIAETTTIVDPDKLYAEFMAQAAALKPGAVGGADGLEAEIASSSLPETVFKPLAGAIAKTTGLDAEAIKRRLNKARGAPDSSTNGATDTLGCATDPEPAANPQPPAALLDTIVKVINARVRCSAEVADAVALWVVGTWGVYPPSDPDNGPDLFPRLHLSSPTKRCGKSTLLEIVQHTVRRPLAATDTSEAALFRAVGRWRPTLIIDEADRLFAKNRDLVGIVNSGYTRTGQVVRTIEVQTQGGRDFEPVGFPTFCPIALAGIGSLASTIEDRSLRVVLERQLPGRQHKRIGLRQLRELRTIIGPHLMAYTDALGSAMAKGVPDSSIPAILNDRDADNWRPLLAIAALAGGNWSARAHAAAAALCRESADSDRGAEWAFRQIVEGIVAQRREAVEAYLGWRTGGRKTVKPFPGRPGSQRPAICRFIASDDLAVWLMSKDDSGFGNGRDIGVVKLRVARVLRPFGARPTSRKVDGKTVRGYDVPPIRVAWRRYSQ